MEDMNRRVALALVLLLAGGCTRTIPADVSSFVAKVRRTRLDPDRHDPRALQFYEECVFLQEKHASVTRWPSLEAVRQELAQYLNAHPPELSRWRDKIVSLRRDCARAAAGGRFNDAMRQIEEFGARFGGERDAELAEALAREQEALERRAVVWARGKCSEAQYDRWMGRKADARRSLLVAVDEVSRFESARALVAKALSEIAD